MCALHSHHDQIVVRIACIVERCGYNTVPFKPVWVIVVGREGGAVIH